MKEQQGVKGQWMRNTLQTFGSQIAIMCITILTGVLLARGLGAEGRGTYIAITMWSNLLYWGFNFGIYQSVIYFSKSYNGDKKVVFTTFLVYGAILCSIATLIAEVLIVPMVTANGSSDIVFAAKIYFLGIFYAAFSEIIISTLAGEEKFGYSNLLRMAVPGLTAIAMLGLYVMGYLSSVTALYASFIISTLLFVMNVVKIIHMKYVDYRIDWRLMWSAFKYGSKSHGGSVASLTSENLTQMVLSLFMPPAALGHYSVAQSATSPVNTITSTIAITTQPKLTAEEKYKVHGRVVELIKKAIILVGIAVAGMTVVLPFGIEFVYGHEFEAAIIPALILLPAKLFDCLSNVMRNALNGAGMTFINTKSELIVLIATLVCMSVFFTRWHLIGAAAATLISSLVRIAIFFIEYRRRFVRFTVAEAFPGKMDMMELYRDAHSRIARGWADRRKRGLSPERSEL
ncbi:lipopolysaccharide biosynthesis protein [Paenibacillus gorillae]|uniref:lipopolysaccharide biosynthesis protein n=1 Tax=Paenibacillus gorillae TaxID=1243662 RepID=UPI0004BBB91C|nr:lipopolysaccharide biosynthesis protein [Paenibacillus gorillae]